jgi:hypothetical protein
MSYDLEDADPLGGSLIPKHSARFADGGVGGGGGGADDSGADLADPHLLHSSALASSGGSPGHAGGGGGAHAAAVQRVFTYAEVNGLVTAIAAESVRQRYSALVDLGAPARTPEWQSVVGNRLGRKGIATVFRDLSSHDRGMRIAAAKLVCDLAYGNAENQQLISFHAGFTVGHVRVFTSPRNLRQIFGSRKIVDNNDLQSALEDFVTQFPATKNRRFWCYPPYRPNLANLFPDPDAYLIGFYTFEDPESIPIFRVPTRAEADAASEARAPTPRGTGGGSSSNSGEVRDDRIAVSSPPSRKQHGNGGGGRPQTSTAQHWSAAPSSPLSGSGSGSGSGGGGRGGARTHGGGPGSTGRRPATATARIGGRGGAGVSSGSSTGRPPSSSSGPAGRRPMSSVASSSSSSASRKKTRSVLSAFGDPSAGRGGSARGGSASKAGGRGSNHSNNNNNNNNNNSYGNNNNNTTGNASASRPPSSMRPRSAPSLRASKNLKRWREAATRAGAARSAMSRTFWDSIDAETHMTSSSISATGTLNLTLHPAVAGYKWNSAVAQRRILAMRSEVADSSGKFTDGINEPASLAERPGSARPGSARPMSARSRPGSARHHAGGGASAAGSSASNSSSAAAGGISTGPGAGDRKQFAVDVYSSPFKSMGPSMQISPADPAATMLDFQNMLVNSERNETADTGERRIRRTDTIVGLVVPGAQVSSGSLTLDKMAVNDMRIARRNARASQAASAKEAGEQSIHGSTPGRGAVTAM